MLKLFRENDKVFCNNVELKINKQASKGPGKECVCIEGLEGSNGQKWVSLSTLREGENEVETKARQVTTYQRYNLTAEEKAEIKAHQDAIDAIIEKAKNRYVPPINLNKIDISQLNAAQRAELQAKLEELLATKTEK